MRLPIRQLASGSVAHVQDNGDVSHIEPLRAVLDDIEPSPDDYWFVDQEPEPDPEAA